jgi:hypothetical protein
MPSNRLHLRNRKTALQKFRIAKMPPSVNIKIASFSFIFVNPDFSKSF